MPWEPSAMTCPWARAPFWHPSRLLMSDHPLDMLRAEVLSSLVWHLEPLVCYIGKCGLLSILSE